MLALATVCTFATGYINGHYILEFKVTIPFEKKLSTGTFTFIVVAVVFCCSRCFIVALLLFSLLLCLLPLFVVFAVLSLFCYSFVVQLPLYFFVVAVLSLFCFCCSFFVVIVSCIQPVSPLTFSGPTRCKRAKPVWWRDDRNSVTSD